MRVEPVRPSYLAPKIQVLGFRAVGRVCSQCLDPVALAGRAPAQG